MAIDNRGATNGHKRSSICKAERVSDAARDRSLSEIGTLSALGLRHQKSTKDSNCFFPGYKENIVAVEGKARLMA